GRSAPYNLSINDAVDLSNLLQKHRLSKCGDLLILRSLSDPTDCLNHVAIDHGRIALAVELNGDSASGRMPTCVDWYCCTFSPDIAIDTISSLATRPGTEHIA